MTNRAFMSRKNARIRYLFLMVMTDSGFGLRLKQAYGNIKNKEIARKMGVSPSAIQHYIGGRVPDGDTLRLIATQTGCDLHWLITGENAQNVNTERADETNAEPLIAVNEAALRNLVHEFVREETGTGKPKDEIGPLRKADIMLARSLGKVDGGDEEEKIRKTG